MVSRNPKATDFRTVSIAAGEAEAIRKRVIDENATNTPETSYISLNSDLGKEESHGKQHNLQLDLLTIPKIL